jgi:prolyl-tRNA editing enzyme YbaK/EbsC (Cys-tRNA(Pro) deacylase)
MSNFKYIKNIAKKNSFIFEHYPSAYRLPVITCIEASFARGVALSQELKHIVINSSFDEHVVHVLGDKRVSLRKVEKILNVQNLKLSNLKPSMHRGKISPFIDPFWSMLNLIDANVLQKKWLTTNDGTLRGYIKFSPKLLLQMPNIEIGDFAK